MVRVGSMMEGADMKARRGFGSVYQRGRTWWVAYRYAGKQRYESSHSYDRRVAVKMLKRRLG